jgi:hypothetical protein
MATTYLLMSDDIIQSTQLGHAWSDALALLWTGDYDGTPRLLAMDLQAGTVTDCTNAALMHLADRAEHEGETPRHLDPLLDAAGLAYPTERQFRRPVSCAGMGRLVLAGVR